MGGIVLPFDGIERNDAQFDARATSLFSRSLARRILGVQVNPSSTAMDLQVQDRYPSPLKRSAFASRPLFLFRSSGWRHCADAHPVRRAVFRPIRGVSNKMKLFPVFRCWVSKSNQGEPQCVRHSSLRLLSPRPSLFQLVTATLNAALWAPAPARPLPLQLAVAQSLVPLSAAPLACSVTTPASANKNQTTDNKTNRAGMRASASRPFLMQDPQSIGWARGDLT